MKESRLFKIVYRLLNHGRTTASELAKEFDVSVRTIYRDIDALSEAGIPVYAETGRNGGISLMENFVIDKMLLSESEKKEILSSLQSLTIIDNPYENQVLTKLSALFDTEQENWFEVDFSRWGHKSHDNEKFELIKQGLLNYKILEISYVDSSGQQTVREINPLKFLYKSKDWYIKSYCNDKQDYRIFKFNRITDLKLTHKTFVPTAFPEIKEADEESHSKIVLKFMKKIAHRVYDEFDNSKIVLAENDDLIATSYMPEDSWLIGYLLSFGSDVEVLEPESLKDILREEAVKIYETNKS